MAEGESKRYQGFFIALAIFGVGTILSFGLCTALVTTNNGARGSNSETLGEIFLVLFFVCLFGFVVTLLLLVIALIIKASTNQ